MHPQWMSVFTASVGWFLAFVAWNNVDAILLILVGAFSMLQHLTESLQNVGPILKINTVNPKIFLALDRIMAISMLLISSPRIVNPTPTFAHVILAMGALSLLIMCDAGFFEDACTYSMVHSLWHIEIYAFIYLRIQASHPNCNMNSNVNTAFD